MNTPDLTKPTRLIRRNHFFNIHVIRETVITRYGKGTGTGGRETRKKFHTSVEALNAASDIFNSKIADDYKINVTNIGTAPQDINEINQDTTSNQAVRRSGRKRSQPATYNPSSSSGKRFRGNVMPKASAAGQAAKPTKSRKLSLPAMGKRQRRGLRGAAAVDTSSRLGIVDPASGISGTIVSEAAPSGEQVYFDAMLVFVDIVKRQDKFIVLQLIYDSHTDKFFFYERYGRTGTSGQSLKVEYLFYELLSAMKEFKKKFNQKTGLQWENREDPPVPSKYRFVKQDFQAKHEAAISDQPTWQYWVDDGVDGKATGWYNYDQFGNVLSEQLYMEFLSNAWLTKRIVQSGTYSYLVNLESMTQQNVVHSNHTVRHIRRVPPNETPDDTNPTDEFPDTTVTNANNVQVMTMRVTKPNVNVPVPKPSHKVVPAPAAIIPSKTKKPKQAAKSGGAGQTVKGSEAVEIPVDDLCPKANEFHVIGDWDAMMNQSNIMEGNNNNKYYKIQLLEHDKRGTFHVWTRWGRVGESHGTQTKLMGPYKEVERAEKVFSKKFRDKTGNSWKNRDNFVAVEGKYVLLEIDHITKKEEDTEPLIMKIKTEDEHVEYLPSTLPQETKQLVDLLFEKDVYTNAMKEFDIDVRKMPLGKLSKDQIEKGVAVLEEIEEVINGNPSPTGAEFARLSSKFYTILPHDFGRRRPPVISNMTMLQHSYDMCNVLKDMEKASTLMSEANEKTAKQKDKKKVPNPADAQYGSLNADLDLLEPGSKEYKTVSAAYHNTIGSYTSKMLNVWRVERKGETERFGKINLPNHMLLWHGSHIGAISAILATGLRIMPHSGGRVGRGIYLASENGKSQAYMTPAMHNSTGCMFLVEAALGKPREIFQDDGSLQRAPNGYDSVLACGRQTPKGFCTLKLDGTEVSVPVEAPGPNAKAAHSSFWQDEYLIYDEGQARIRYVLTVKN